MQVRKILGIIGKIEYHMQYSYIFEKHTALRILFIVS